MSVIMFIRHKLEIDCFENNCNFILPLIAFAYTNANPSLSILAELFDA